MTAQAPNPPDNAHHLLNHEQREAPGIDAIIRDSTAIGLEISFQCGTAMQIHPSGA
jgi:hypothetical protein